jgi:integrase
MKCQEKLPRQFPHEVRVGNVPVKIYRGKTRGYNMFTVVHYRAGSRRRQTFARFADARAEAQEIATQIARGRIDVLNLTSSDRENYLAATNLLRPLGVPLHAAIEEYVAAREQLNGGSVLAAAREYASRHHNVSDKSVAEIVAALLAAKTRDGLSARYIQTLRSHLNRFAAAFQTRIGSVTTKMIDDWLAQQSIGPRARNNMRMSAVTLFRFARAQNYLPKGQPTEADYIARAKDRGGKIGILTTDQMSALMKAAEPEQLVYLALGGFAGLRRAEIERIEWSDVNFERGHITVAADKAKTATRRLVPIQPNLMEWLAPHHGNSGKVFSGKRATDRVIQFAKDTLKKTGLNGGEWPSNALRHSYGSYRLAAIADTARVALEMGNSPQKLMTNYRELADEHDAAAWFAISPKRPANVVHLAAVSRRGRG